MRRGILAVCILAALSLAISCTPVQSQGEHTDDASGKSSDGGAGSSDSMFCDSSDFAKRAAAFEAESTRRAPTDAEIQNAAYLWALAIVGKSDGQVASESVDDTDLGAVLRDLPSSYPGLFGTCEIGTTSQPLITTPADFSCDGTCNPSFDAYKTTGKKIIDTALDAIVGERGELLGSARKLVDDVRSLRSLHLTERIDVIARFRR